MNSLINKIKFYIKFYFHPDKSIKFNNDLSCWIAKKKISKKDFFISFRSFKEIRRFDQLENPKFNDLVFKFIMSKFKIKNFYDVGSSNGIYGFLANRIQSCNVVFIEPYTPSIESILKTIYLLDDKKKKQFNVVQAGIDSRFSFSKFFFHKKPIPGETMNSFSDVSMYEHLDRKQMKVPTFQWGAGISIDELVFKCKLPDPSVVKIDVDGFELEAIKGMKRCLEQNKVKAFIIEINSKEKYKKIYKFLEKFNFEEIDHSDHYESQNLYIRDYIFVKDKNSFKKLIY